LDDPTIEMVVLCKGAQTGGTYTAYCWLAKEMHTDPGSALIVMSTVDVARKKAQSAWLPMWEDSPKLKPHIPKRRRTEWTKLRQILFGSPIGWIGANSPAGLASVDIRRLVLDEVDKYPQSFGRGKNKRSQSQASSEAGAMELAIQRTKTYQRNSTAKIFILSTPTDEQGPVWVEYSSGDQRKLHVPCWKCGTMQVMEWPGFKIDMELAKTDPHAAAIGCRFACKTCEALWDDDQRFTAIDAGEWRPTVVSRDPLRRSYHLPSWCSKFVTNTALARKWIVAQGNRSRLQDFMNGEAAECWKHYDESISHAAFAKVEGEYMEGDKWADLPHYARLYEGRDKFVVGGVDVQKGYLVAVFREFVQGGDSGLVWGGTVSGFDALDQLAEKYGAVYVFIDSRYRTYEVNQWAFDHRGYIPCQGVQTRARSLFVANQVDIDEGKRSRGDRMVTMLAHDPDMLKDILSNQIQRRYGFKRWMVPRGYGRNVTYCDQMTAEKSVNGKWAPNPPGKPNHFWDAECLCLLGACYLKIWEEVYADSNDDKQR
jgi:hypothetical protein